MADVLVVVAAEASPDDVVDCGLVSGVGETVASRTMGMDVAMPCGLVLFPHSAVEDQNGQLSHFALILLLTVSAGDSKGVSLSEREREKQTQLCNSPAQLVSMNVSSNVLKWVPSP